MPGQPRPWYRGGRSMWFATLAGKQVPLEITDPTDEAAAWQALQRLLAQAKPAATPRTVAEIVTAFLVDAESRLKPTTMKGYRWYGDLFANHFGERKAADLTADDLERAARRPAWSSSTRNNYLSTAETVLRWAKVRLDRPLRKPPKESAGAESIIPEPVFRRVLQFCTGDWYAVTLFLWHTGCRPCEASAVTTEAVDWDGRVVRLKDHKTARHGKGDRIIYLNDEAFEVLTWQRAKYGSGLLFRGIGGRQLSQQAFAMKFLRVSGKVGTRVTSYGFRHSYATRALAAGESDAIVAALLGHAGTGMIHKHYSHTSAMGRQLKDAASRIGRAG